MREGDYVRAIYGVITQITNIPIQGASVNHRVLETENGCLFEEQIIKSSSNIMSLIDKGDFCEIEFYSLRYCERLTRIFEVDTYADTIIFENSRCTLRYDLKEGEWLFGDGKLEPLLKSVLTKERFKERIFEL